MKWKLFAIVMAVFFAWGLTLRPRDILDLVSIPIDGLATAGLLAYAFRFQRVQTRLWAAFAWTFAAWSLFQLAVGVLRNLEHGSPAYAIVGGLGLVAAMMYWNWVALHRIGRAKFA